ncbi:TlpA family protein disulfide reductase [Pseudomonas aeruginosa]|uniref:TlpA family protein disulfide reductase n=1 Tax=Pseudomonas aeruginosa TaxID=287 RepID=UPI0008777DC4|nr:TlpA disulfide reductase family protein [Pseudomonas aeruginosa]
MLSFSLGPLVVSLQHLLLFLALGAALLGGWLAARGGGRNAEPVLFNLLLLGLLVARLAFVVRYWPQYRGDFAQMLDIRDGGFLAWPGLLAAVLGALFWAWRRPALRRSLGVGASLGLAFWLLGSLGLGIYERGTRLPELSLRNAAGEAVQLADFRGRPLVINLWASWCPPCRREMPVLQQAQAENPDVVFLFANQGESAETVRHFLQGENLRLDNLLFDNGGQLGQQVGSVALPTTVFYTAEGRLLGSHLGELSRGSLARYLEAFEPAAAAPATRSSE